MTSPKPTRCHGWAFGAYTRCFLVSATRIVRPATRGLQWRRRSPIRGLTMSPQVDELVAAVLRLTEPEQAEVLERLLDALGPPPSDIDRMTEEEFAAELDRRHAEFLRDPTVGIPWEEVLRKHSFE